MVLRGRFAAAVAMVALLPAQIEAVAARCAPCDVDGDGIAEVEALAVLGGAGEAGAPRVVVLVEPRLLAEPDVAGLRARLDRFAADLGREGYRADLVAAQVYAGARHQDGRTLLGLRRFLQAVAADAAAAHTSLAGAVLVGHFPDALLLRTCNWRRGGAVTLRDRSGADVALGDGVQYLRAVPELVAHKCDLVLADLDGDWEGRYFAEPTVLPSVVAQFAEGRSDTGPDGRGGACAAMAVAAPQFVDAFHVHDGRAVVDADAFAVAVDDAQRDFECTAEDRAHANAIARPDIAVSRIDARGVAWSPRAEFLADGVPHAHTGKLADVWRPDLQLELRLLADYFDRNHAFRTSPIDADADRPAAIAWGLGSGMRSLRAASVAWREFAAEGYDVVAHSDLLALVAWLRRPAVLRSLSAHSNGHYAQFAATDAAALKQAIGGAPWNFVQHGGEVVPSLQGNAGGAADFFFYRTLWQDGALPPQPFLLVHMGCEAVSPPGAERLRYDDPHYGERQHAESILFFTSCLAIVGRAKVFYDEPRGFCEALGAGGTVGDGWRRYFEREGAAADWDEVGGDIGRKRAYFWSLLGDFTLRLRR